MEMYVLQVQPGFEISAADVLKKRGYRAMCPAEESYIRRGGQWHRYERLIFTQYIFVECDLDDKAYYDIKSVFGVVRFLGFGKPEPLPPDERGQIDLLYNGGKPIEPSKIYTTSSGDKMIISGILRQYSDSIISLDVRQRRAKVDVEFCGKKHRITLPVIGI